LVARGRRYDRFGNRWQQNGPTNTFVATFTGNNQSNPQNNNRIDGYAHDAAGNIMSDGLHSYTFDAENRMIKVDGGSTATYSYDVDGHRVQKITTTGNYSDPAGTWIFFYDQSGRFVLEANSNYTFVRGHIYAGSRHLASVGGWMTFNHSDWVGTERFRTYMSGIPYQTESCSSLPFGDGLNCVGSDVDPLHFTGKERDAATGLDNFGARYNSSSFGRFMSPDPKQVQAHIFDPQTFNRYAYARNNPNAYIDPDGRDLKKAWDDVKTFAKSVTIKATIGLGYEAHAEVGKAEAKLGVAAKGSIELSSDSAKLSRSASLGFEAGQSGAKVGESITVQQTVMTVTDTTVTGAEKPEITRTDSLGLFGGNLGSSSDKIGIGLELPAGELPVVGGVDVETTKEGLNALKSAAKEVQDSLRNPGPPPPPVPPPPPPTPPCSANGGRKC
jgi:RHS repeat-associated protein